MTERGATAATKAIARDHPPACGMASATAPP